MSIKHDNIVYAKDISEIGGVETWIYEIVKKYKDLDIAVVYKTAHPKQLERLQKYCPTYRHTNEDIICKVAIINYDTSIIDYITKDIWKENAKPNEGIYQAIHADYEHKAYQWRPPTDDRIKAYIGITKHIAQSFQKMTGNENIIQLYNPLTLNEDDETIMLVSATRLSKIKGKDRMIKFANAMDRQGLKWIWYVFTNDTKEINNPNFVFLKPRLDCRHLIKRADALVQVSDTEGDPYSCGEASGYNVPIIVTPLPFLEEKGYKDGVNCHILKFDCSNADEIAKRLKDGKLKFKWNIPDDNYKSILFPGKSKYQERKRTRCEVEATTKYFITRTHDVELSIIKNVNRYIPEVGDKWETSYERAQALQNKGFVNTIREIKPNKEE